MSTYRVACIISLDIDGYKHIFLGFSENFAYPIPIKIGENDHKSRCSCNPCRNFILYSLSLLVKSIEEEIQPFSNGVNTVGGWTLKQLQ